MKLRMCLLLCLAPHLLKFFLIDADSETPEIYRGGSLNKNMKRKSKLKTNENFHFFMSFFVEKNPQGRKLKLIWEVKNCGLKKFEYFFYSLWRRQKWGTGNYIKGHKLMREEFSGCGDKIFFLESFFLLNFNLFFVTSTKL